MPEWLSNTEYNRSLRQRNRGDIWDETIRAERWATQVAFSQLGVREGMPVSVIPGVDMWHDGEPNSASNDWTAIPVVTLEGSVGAGKSTLVAGYLKGRPFFEMFEFVKDGIHLLRNDIRHFEQSDLMYYHALVEVASNLAYYQARISPISKSFFVKERGDLDQQAFRRAHLLRGSLGSDYAGKRVKAAEYFLGSALQLLPGIEGAPIFDLIIKLSRPAAAFGPEEYLSSRSLTLNAQVVVNFLIRPSLMAIRRKKHYSHERLRLWWELYRQHVRLHHEIISGKINVPNYFCFNAEGSLEENQSKFNSLMSDVIGRMGGQPRLAGVDWLMLRGKRRFMEGTFRELEG